MTRFLESFSPPEGIFAFATIGALLLVSVLLSFSPPEGIFAFATGLNGL